MTNEIATSCGEEEVRRVSGSTEVGNSLWAGNDEISVCNIVTILHTVTGAVYISIRLRASIAANYSILSFENSTK
jgi:hypothetical protein